MKAEERDALERRRVEALEGIASELASSAAARRDRERRERSDDLHETFVSSARPDYLFEGASGQRVLMRIPAYVTLWKGVVPVEALVSVCDRETRQEWPLVSCRCGAQTSLEHFSARECTGGCGRAFLALEQEVRFMPAPAESA